MVKYHYYLSSEKATSPFENPNSKETVKMFIGMDFLQLFFFSFFKLIVTRAVIVNCRTVQLPPTDLTDAKLDWICKLLNSFRINRECTHA